MLLYLKTLPIVISLLSPFAMLAAASDLRISPLLTEDLQADALLRPEDRIMARLGFRVRNEDVTTLNQIKFVMGARQILVRDLGLLVDYLSGMRQRVDNLPVQSLEIPEEVLELFPRREYPEFYADWALHAQHNRGPATHIVDPELWLYTIVKKSFALFKYDLDLYLWQYAPFPSPLYERKQRNPSDAVRKKTVTMLQNARAQVLTGNHDAFLLLPHYKAVQWKSASEFFMFAPNPAYFLYQHIVGVVWHHQGVLGMDPEAFATWVNLPHWDNRDRNDPRFIELLRDTELLKSRIQETKIEKNVAAIARPLVLATLDKEKNHIKTSFSLFDVQPHLGDMGQYSPRKERSIFAAENDAFFQHYGFMYFIPYLQIAVEARFRQYSTAFSIFQVRASHHALFAHSMAYERNYVDDMTAGVLYTLGVAALFGPYSQVLTPLLFAAGASYTVLLKNLPHLMYASRLVSFTHASSDVFGSTVIAGPQSQQDLQTRHQIHQEAQAAMATSLAVDVPFFFAPAIFKLRSSVKTLPLTDPKAMKLLWSTQWNKFYAEFFKQPLAQQSKRFIVGQVLKGMVRNHDIWVATGYFAGIFALQAYYDRQNRETSPDLVDGKLTSAIEAIERRQSIDFEKEHGKKMLADTQALARTLRSLDRRQRLDIMKSFYRVPKTLSGSWLRLYDGDHPIFLFGTLYFPLQEFEKIRTLAKDQRRRQMLAQIIPCYLQQMMLQSDIYRALLQVNMVDFIDRYLHENDARIGARMYKNIMELTFRDHLALSFPLNISVKKVEAEAALWTERYLDQLRRL